MYVSGMWHHGVMYSAHVCKCTWRPEYSWRTPCLPSSLFSLSLRLVLSLNLDTLILALLTSLGAPGMQLPLFLQLWVLWPAFYMVSGAELRSAWSVLLAGSAFGTEPPTCSVLTVRVPCSQPQIGPCGACSCLWLLRSYWLWSRVSCGQSVVSHSHSWDKYCRFLFSLPLKRDVVSLSLFPLCKWNGVWLTCWGRFVCVRI